MYNFCANAVYPECPDGFQPTAGLVQAADGYLYGTAYYGGANYSGTIFKITPHGEFTTVYNFCSQSNCTDGAYPLAGLIQASDESFYGTNSLAGAYGGGTVYRITPDGKLTTLHSFCAQSACPDGVFPTSVLSEGPDGGFYGTTEWGGANATCPSLPFLPATCGTVFKITPEGAFSMVHSFEGADGANPYGGVVHAANDEFYGTTSLGGDSNSGTIFKVTASGAFTTLASFNGTDGAFSYSALIQANDGLLYGATSSGGTSGDGTLFKITPDGALTSLYSFDGTNGLYPQAALIQDTNGKFYGTTYGGGGNATCSGYDGCGTIYELSAGLGPFVAPLPMSGRVGSAVRILGTNLGGATSVTFNGTPAEITSVSPTEILTTVPAGATTGKVEVTTKKEILLSKAPFRVIR